MQNILKINILFALSVNSEIICKQCRFYQYIDDSECYLRVICENDRYNRPGKWCKGYLGCVSGGDRCAYMHVLARANILFLQMCCLGYLLLFSIVRHI